MVNGPSLPFNVWFVCHSCSHWLLCVWVLGISCYADNVRTKSSEELGFLCCMYDLGVFPFRIELVGAWVDHPFISGFYPVLL